MKTVKTQRPTMAKNIRNGRKALGMNQERFAELIGVHVNTVKDLERGISRGKAETLKAITEAFGIAEWELLRPDDQFLIRKPEWDETDPEDADNRSHDHHERRPQNPVVNAIGEKRLAYYAGNGRSTLNSVVGSEPLVGQSPRDVVDQDKQRDGENYTSSDEKLVHLFSSVTEPLLQELRSLREAFERYKAEQALVTRQDPPQDHPSEAQETKRRALADAARDKALKLNPALGKSDAYSTKRRRPKG